MDSDLQTNLIPSRVCMVGFASMGEDCGGGIPPFEWAKTFSDMSVATALMRDRRAGWYQGGVEGLGNIAAVKSWMQEEVCARYPYVITAGVSMGGYAAILFGLLAGVDEVIAMSPQTFIDPEGTLLPEDTRWRRHWTDHMPPLEYRTLHSVPNRGTNVRIFLGENPENPGETYLDHRHAHHLPYAQLNSIPNCSHSNVGKHLRDSGFFRDLVALRTRQVA